MDWGEKSQKPPSAQFAQIGRNYFSAWATPSFTLGALIFNESIGGYSKVWRQSYSFKNYWYGYNLNTNRCWIPSNCLPHFSYSSFSYQSIRAWNLISTQNWICPRTVGAVVKIEKKIFQKLTSALPCHFLVSFCAQIVSIILKIWHWNRKLQSNLILYSCQRTTTATLSTLCIILKEKWHNYAGNQ